MNLFNSIPEFAAGEDYLCNLYSICPKKLCDKDGLTVEKRCLLVEQVVYAENLPNFQGECKDIKAEIKR